jgi:hypothetical protein
MNLRLSYIVILLGVLLVDSAGAQTRTRRALIAAGSPAPLVFLLDATRLPSDLDQAIAQDIRSLPPPQAREQILDRLRANIVATKTLDAKTAAQAQGAAVSSLGAIVNVDPNTAQTWRRALGIVARAPTLTQDPSGLRAALPERRVIATTLALYGRQAGVLQVNPLTPLNDNGPAESSSPSTLTTAALSPQIGHSGSQVNPLREAEQLKDCDKPFEQLTEACDASANGMRCETFSRGAFPEVARITTPEGGICSGTLIGRHWVLSAAHCFLGGRSAGEFIASFASRRTPAGDARLRGADLAQTELHLFNTGRLEARRNVDHVIVHRSWNPHRVISEGKEFTLGSTTRTADFIYPGDMALVRITDDDAVDESVLPARLPVKDWTGVITTAGYGVTTVGDGAAGKLFVSWPEPYVRSGEGQLELVFKNDAARPAKLISTFCVGDSGGPAYAARHRGCQIPPNVERPRTVVGVTSYYWGYRAGDARNIAESAKFCETAPVMRFVNLATSVNRNWICEVTGGEAKGC